MSDIQMKDVEKVAKLAKLEFDGEEKEKFAEQFQEILGFVERISEIPADVKPTTHAISNSNVMRPDEIGTSFTIEEIEAVAPRLIDGHIVVPKVIEH